MEKYVRIAIEDNGPGMTQSVLQEAFEIIRGVYKTPGFWLWIVTLKSAGF